MTMTYEAIIAEVRRLAESQPDRVNPVDPRTDSCRYVADTDDDFAVRRHCIVGQAIVNLWDIPDRSALDFLDAHEGHGADGVLYDLLDLPLGGTEPLYFVQQLADGQTQVDGQPIEGEDFKPRPWGEVLRIATEKGWL